MFPALVCASQNKKAHRNGIKKPVANKYSKTKGVSAAAAISCDDANIYFLGISLSSLTLASLLFPPLLFQMDPKFLRNQVCSSPE